MKLINKQNEKFVKTFFENHKVFFCDDLPWQLYNIENGRFSQDTNLHTRAEYLFSKNGFFNETYKERNPEYIESEKRKNLDYCFFHRQRRYIVQELITNNFYNPTHHSFITENKEQIDFDNLKFDDLNPQFYLATHPGNTRFESSCFLRKNLNKCLLYVNKDKYYDGYFKNNLVEIKSIEEVYNCWRFVRDIDKKNLRFNFLGPVELQDDINFKNGTKYHEITKCNVLKLWNIKESPTPDNLYPKNNLLHTLSYVKRCFDSSEKIAETMFEKKLTIYTNSTDDVKLYFKLIRNKLVSSAKKIMERYKRSQYFFDKLKYYDFDVVVVDKKPKDISELNENKGFAIWIDQSILYDIKREIYEFTFFTRKDIKSAETKDGKISIVNCRNTGNKKWTIHKEFYL